MKSFLEYLNEEGGPGHGPAGGHGGPGHMGGHGPMGGHHGPAPMPHGGSAGGLGFGFGPAMPRPRPAVIAPPVVPGYGLSFLTPLNTTWWTTPVWNLYSSRWPTDPYGRLINQNLTFADLAKALDLAISPYDAIGTDNPKVVKKILKLLAKLLGKTYDEVHDYQPQSGLFTDHDAQIDALSQKLGVLLAPIADKL